MLARGKYVAYLHDDDLLKDNYICEITKILRNKKYHDAGAFILDRDYVNEHPQANIKPRKRNIIGTIKNKTLRALLYFRHFYRKDITELTPYMSIRTQSNLYANPSCGCVFNREKLIKDGGWNEKGYPAADWYTFMRFNEKHKFYRVRKKLGIYRWDDNVSLTIHPKLWAACYMNLLVKKWRDEKINRFVAKNIDILATTSVFTLSQQDFQELHEYFGLKVSKPSRIRVKLFNNVKFIYILLHNLD